MRTIQGILVLVTGLILAACGGGDNVCYGGPGSDLCATSTSTSKASSVDVQINKDSPGALFAGVPSIDTKSIETKVLVENGGTVVIGGIFEQQERTDVSKVPFLGDIPYLGNLFKTTNKQSNKVELLIFLTPKVVNERTTR